MSILLNFFNFFENWSISNIWTWQKESKEWTTYKFSGIWDWTFFLAKQKKRRNWLDNWSAQGLIKTTWTSLRVDMVGTNHNKVLYYESICQWVSFLPIFFWYDLLPLTTEPQKFSKIRVLKVNYFLLPRKKNLKLKSWLNFNDIIVSY